MPVDRESLVTPRLKKTCPARSTDPNINDMEIEPHPRTERP